MIKDNYLFCKYILGTKNYKYLFLTIIMLVFSNIFNLYSSISFEESIYVYFTNTLFVLVMFLVFFISSSFVINYYDNNFGLLLRYKNKKYYLQESLLSITICNFILYFFATFLSLFLLSIRSFGNIKFGYISYYNIPYLFYNCFTIFKQFSILNLFTILGICIYKIFDKIPYCLYTFLIIMLYYLMPIESNIINSFNIKYFFFKYQISIAQFSNFSLELSYALLTICSLNVILACIISYMIKYNKIKIEINR